MAMYKGSLTEEGCPSSVTWLVNLTPHAIKREQLEQMKSLLDQSLFETNCQTSAGDTDCVPGNGRNIWPEHEDRVVTYFNNRQNIEDSKSMAKGLLNAIAMNLIIICLVI